MLLAWSAPGSEADEISAKADIGHVTDIGWESCGLWSHGFVRRIVDLGCEMKGFSVSVWVSDLRGFGRGGERILGWWVNDFLASKRFRKLITSEIG